MNKAIVSIDKLNSLGELVQNKKNSDSTFTLSEIAEELGDLQTKPAKGLVFGDYDANGYPHSAEFVGEWVSIPPRYAYRVMDYGSNSYNTSNFGRNVSYIKIPDTVSNIGESAFSGCGAIETFDFPNSPLTIESVAFSRCAKLTDLFFKDSVTFPTNSQQTFAFAWNLKTVTFGGNVNAICNSCFRETTGVSLYDFSKCTAIPPLYNTDGLRHKSGCVIKIPSALSDTTLGEGNGWESATNWIGLTNIVWEVV